MQFHGCLIAKELVWTTSAFSKTDGLNVITQIYYEDFQLKVFNDHLDLYFNPPQSDGARCLTLLYKCWYFVINWTYSLQLGAKWCQLGTGVSGVGTWTFCFISFMTNLLDEIFRKILEHVSLRIIKFKAIKTALLQDSQPIIYIITKSWGFDIEKWLNIVLWTKTLFRFGFDWCSNLLNCWSSRARTLSWSLKLFYWLQGRKEGDRVCICYYVTL